jgi:hypothetical protein
MNFIRILRKLNLQISQKMKFAAAQVHNRKIKQLIEKIWISESYGKASFRSPKIAPSRFRVLNSCSKTRNF